MTVAATADRQVDTAGPGQAGGPFVVRGTVHGRATEVAVCTPAEALRVIVGWCAADDEASGCWALRPDEQLPVTAVARDATVQARQTRRVAHLFRFDPGVPQTDRLTAECGEGLRLLDAEWLDLGHGMPCEACVARHHSEAA